MLPSGSMNVTLGGIMQETRRGFLKTALSAAAVVGAGVSASFPRESFALVRGSDTAFWASVRQGFMLDPQLHYHNIGGTGAYPRIMVQNFDENNKIVARNPDAGMNIGEMRTEIAPGFGVT